MTHPSTTAAQPSAPGRGRHDGLRLVALLGGLLLLGARADQLAPAVQPPVDTAVAQEGAAWEGRRLLAQLLWVKTHAVLHAGAEEREARPGEETTRGEEFHGHAGEEHEGGEHAEEGHEGEKGHVLLIPPAREDFRGPLGDLERAVKPYAAADGKLYSKAEDQTLPFYRLMTWADPHYVQGYTVGATFIGKAGQHADEGLAFLHEGERHNPRSFEIQMELGHFYLVYKKDAARAEAYLRRSVELAPRGRELSEAELEALTDAYRWLVLAYRQQAKHAEAARVAREGLQRVGEDAVLRRALQPRPTGVGGR